MTLTVNLDVMLMAETDLEALYDLVAAEMERHGLVTQEEAETEQVPITLADLEATWDEFEAVEVGRASWRERPLGEL